LFSGRRGLGGFRGLGFFGGLIEGHQTANADENESVIGHGDTECFGIFLALSTEVSAGHATWHSAGAFSFTEPA
jgi:hypothetical protein